MVFSNRFTVRALALKHSSSVLLVLGMPYISELSVTSMAEISDMTRVIWLIFGCLCYWQRKIRTNGYSKQNRLLIVSDYRRRSTGGWFTVLKHDRLRMMHY